jgi:hypothetical protein
MDLIERYVFDVGHRLPRRMRADVEAELRSLLGEALDERARAAGRPADAELAAQVLRGFGPPREVAARYTGEPRYLIGPHLFPAYLLTLKIAGIAILVVFAVMAIARLVAAARGYGGASGFLAVFHAAGDTFHGALFNLGVLTLIFALVERVQARKEAAGKDWDPATLPPVKDRDRISVVNKIFSTYAIVALVVLFNFFPQWVGFWALSGGRWSGLPLLLPSFSMHLPLLNLWWAAAFVLDLVVLREGRWQRSTRWAELAVGVLGIVVLLVIILGPQVFLFDLAVKSALAVPLIIGTIETCVRLFRLLVRGPAETFRV